MLAPTYIDSMIQQQPYNSSLITVMLTPTFIDSIIHQQQSYHSDASPYLY